MSDKKGNIFIDTNILIYRSFGTESQKEKIQQLFLGKQGKIFISIQVLSEFINVSIKKGLFESENELDIAINYFHQNFKVSLVEYETLKKGMEIRRKYKIPHYDSVIVATALQNKCEITYTEDLHHGLKIEGKMKIINPFKE